MREAIIIIVICVLAPTIRGIVLGIVGLIYYAIVDPDYLYQIWTESKTWVDVQLFGSKHTVYDPRVPCDRHSSYDNACFDCRLATQKNIDETNERLYHDEKTKGDH